MPYVIFSDLLFSHYTSRIHPGCYSYLQFTHYQCCILHCVNILQFIYSSADGYLGCVQIIAIMNNVAFNILVPVS